MKKAYAAAKGIAIGGFRDLVRETRNYFGVGSSLSNEQSSYWWILNGGVPKRRRAGYGRARDLPPARGSFASFPSPLSVDRRAAETPALFDLALFVQDVLAHSRIVLLNLHLLRMEAFVFGSCVEVARPGRGVEPNLVSHSRSP